MKETVKVLEKLEEQAWTVYSAVENLCGNEYNVLKSKAFDNYFIISRVASNVRFLHDIEFRKTCPKYNVRHPGA